VSRYLLDSNIVSNPTKPIPSPQLLAWLDEQNDEDLFVASLERHQDRYTQQLF
jgi:predicted nucleic acid-binding protein